MGALGLSIYLAMPRDVCRDGRPFTVLFSDEKGLARATVRASARSLRSADAAVNRRKDRFAFNPRIPAIQNRLSWVSDQTNGFGQIPSPRKQLPLMEASR
jgi:hypothetical protein